MSARPFLIVPLLLGLAAAAPASARDYGQQGAVFPIVETDLLAVIRDKLMNMQSSGAIERANKALAARTAARVKRPAPVKGIATATSPRRWTFDPTIVVEQDLKDAKGRVIVARGTRVNPLDTVPLRQRLVFLDGDDPEQVAWAITSTTALNAKLILVKGAPLALMKAQQRRFYFDQAGTLTTRLGIRAVPAIVDQKGRSLSISELVLRGSKEGRQ